MNDTTSETDTKEETKPVPSTDTETPVKGGDGGAADTGTHDEKKEPTPDPAPDADPAPLPDPTPTPAPEPIPDPDKGWYERHLSQTTLILLVSGLLIGWGVNLSKGGILQESSFWIIAGAAVAFLFLFTGSRNIGDGHWMMRFSYLFVICAFVASTVTFFQSGSMNIMRGCMVNEDAPEEVSCGKFTIEGEPKRISNIQWVLNIGGVVRPINGNKGAVDQPTDGHTVTAAQPTDGRTVTAMRPTDDPTDTVAQPTDGPTDTAAQPTDGPTDTVAQPTNGSAPIGYITGGLVIPLYVVIIAMMGGAVSMTRRIPEIQRQLFNYNDALKRGDVTRNPAAGADPIQYREDQLPPEWARERLVFQMMQFLSAPLIAITGFYITQPESVVASVAVAFVSGFASESILRLIRSFSDRLTPNPMGGESDKPAGGAK